MAPPPSAPAGLITDLPATPAGLWTAITVIHEVAGRLADSDPASSDRPRAIAEMCANAAEGIARSRTEPLDVTRARPRSSGADEGLPLVSVLASDCIDLAIELLGNEEEPLTPVEVLAVTRAVTALCAARSLAEGGTA